MEYLAGDLHPKVIAKQMPACGACQYISPLSSQENLTIPMNGANLGACSASAMMNSQLRA